MGNDRQSLDAAYQSWSQAANRRIANTQNGNNWGVGPTMDWASEKANDMNVRRWETVNSPANEKSNEINTTQQRSNDLSKALDAAQNPGKNPPSFGNDAKLIQP